MKRALLAFLLVGATALCAQTPTATPPTVLPPFWRCDLPGGTYEVAIRSIVSVSSHEYIVDGAARVTEVNVDTLGNMAVRFYCIEPITPQTPLGVGQSAIDRAGELAKEIAGRAGQDEVWQRVVKSYPTTTHSHTIEYRVPNEEQLKKIMTSAQTSFESGRGTILKMTE